MVASSVPVLTEADVQALVTPADALRVIEETFAEYGRERSMLSEPPALVVAPAHADAAAFKVKGSRLPGRGITGFRIIADREVPGVGEVTIDYHWVADAATGALSGLVQETPLHRLRTAATGVVTARWLARPGARVAAILGAGHIAAELPALLRQAFTLDEVRIASRRHEGAVAFAERHGGALPVRACRTVDEAVDGADVVIAISSANEPIIRARHIAPGMMVCGLGGGHEIGADALDAADRFVVDDLSYSLTIGSVRGWHRGGMSVDELRRRMTADIGEVAVGARQVRQAPRDSVLAVIQGMACCDLALAAFALERAGVALGRREAG